MYRVFLIKCFSLNLGKIKGLTSIDNDKSPVNDGITKEFSIKVWDVVGELICDPIQQSFLVG